MKPDLVKPDLCTHSWTFVIATCQVLWATSTWNNTSSTLSYMSLTEPTCITSTLSYISSLLSYISCTLRYISCSSYIHLINSFLYICISYKRATYFAHWATFHQYWTTSHKLIPALHAHWSTYRVSSTISYCAMYILSKLNSKPALNYLMHTELNHIHIEQHIIHTDLHLIQTELYSMLLFSYANDFTILQHSCRNK